MRMLINRKQQNVSKDFLDNEATDEMLRQTLFLYFHIESTPVRLYYHLRPIVYKFFSAAKINNMKYLKAVVPKSTNGQSTSLVYTYIDLLFCF